MDKSTILYYDHAAPSLVARYESANMASTYGILMRHLAKGGRILDIGCGSGRDAAFLIAVGFDVIAIDPSLEMISTALRIHPELHGHLFCAGLTLPHDHFLLSKTFDGVISVASVMHMSDAELMKSAAQIRDILSPEGALFVSSSIGRKGIADGRDAHGRLIIERAGQTLRAMFARSGFQTIELCEVADGLNRDMKWVNLVVKRAMSR